MDVGAHSAACPPACQTCRQARSCTAHACPCWSQEVSQPPAEYARCSIRWEAPPPMLQSTTAALQVMVSPSGANPWV